MAKKPRKPRKITGPRKKRGPMSLAQRKAIGRGLARVKGPTRGYDERELVGDKPGKPKAGAKPSKPKAGAKPTKPTKPQGTPQGAKNTKPSTPAKPGKPTKPKGTPQGTKPNSAPGTKRTPPNKVTGGGRQASSGFLDLDAIRNEPEYKTELNGLKSRTQTAAEREKFIQDYYRKAAAADIDHGPDREGGGHGRNRAAQRQALRARALGEDAGILDKDGNPTNPTSRQPDTAGADTPTEPPKPPRTRNAAGTPDGDDNDDQGAGNNTPGNTAQRPADQGVNPRRPSTTTDTERAAEARVLLERRGVDTSDFDPIDEHELQSARTRIDAQGAPNRNRVARGTQTAANQQRAAQVARQQRDKELADHPDMRAAEARAILEQRGVNTDDFDPVDPDVMGAARRRVARQRNPDKAKVQRTTDRMARDQQGDVQARRQQQRQQDDNLADHPDMRAAEAQAILESRGVDTADFDPVDPDVLSAARRRVNAQGAPDKAKVRRTTDRMAREQQDGTDNRRQARREQAAEQAAEQRRQADADLDQAADQAEAAANTPGRTRAQADKQRTQQAKKQAREQRLQARADRLKARQDKRAAKREAKAEKREKGNEEVRTYRATRSERRLERAQANYDEAAEKHPLTDRRPQLRARQRAERQAAIDVYNDLTTQANAVGQPGPERPDLKAMKERHKNEWVAEKQRQRTARLRNDAGLQRERNAARIADERAWQDTPEGRREVSRARRVGDMPAERTAGDQPTAPDAQQRRQDTPDTPDNAQRRQDTPDNARDDGQDFNLDDVTGDDTTDTPTYTRPAPENTRPAPKQANPTNGPGYEANSPGRQERLTDVPAETDTPPRRRANTAQDGPDTPQGGQGTPQRTEQEEADYQARRDKARRERRAKRKAELDAQRERDNATPANLSFDDDDDTADAPQPQRPQANRTADRTADAPQTDRTPQRRQTEKYDVQASRDTDIHTAQEPQRKALAEQAMRADAIEANTRRERQKQRIQAEKDAAAERNRKVRAEREARQGGQGGQGGQDRQDRQAPTPNNEQTQRQKLEKALSERDEFYSTPASDKAANAETPRRAEKARQAGTAAAKAARAARTTRRDQADDAQRPEAEQAGQKRAATAARRAQKATANTPTAEQAEKQAKATRSKPKTKAQTKAKPKAQTKPKAETKPKAQPKTKAQQAAENREARKQFANQDTAELTNEHKTIRDGWGDDLDRDNVDMGDPATQAQFETDQARYRALDTELDARRADTEQAPRRNRADQSVAADADQGDDYLNSLAAAEPTTDQPDPDLINDIATRTDADLEAMDLNTNTPAPVRAAIGRELDRRDPFRTDGHITRSAETMTVPQARKYLDELNPDHGTSDDDIRDNLALRGSENERVWKNSPAWQTGNTDWENEYWMDDNGQDVRETLNTGADGTLNAYDVDFDARNNNAHKMNDELQRFVENKGYLPSRANFRRSLRGERPTPYSQDSASERGKAARQAPRRTTAEKAHDDRIAARRKAQAAQAGEKGTQGTPDLPTTSTTRPEPKQAPKETAAAPKRATPAPRKPKRTAAEIKAAHAAKTADAPQKKAAAPKQAPKATQAPKSAPKQATAAPKATTPKQDPKPQATTQQRRAEVDKRIADLPDKERDFALKGIDDHIGKMGNEKAANELKATLRTANKHKAAIDDPQGGPHFDGGTYIGIQAKVDKLNTKLGNPLGDEIFPGTRKKIQAAGKATPAPKKPATKPAGKPATKTQAKAPGAGKIQEGRAPKNARERELLEILDTTIPADDREGRREQRAARKEATELGLDTRPKAQRDAPTVEAKPERNASAPAPRMSEFVGRKVFSKLDTDSQTTPAEWRTLDSVETVDTPDGTRYVPVFKGPNGTTHRGPQSTPKNTMSVEARDGDKLNTSTVKNGKDTVTRHTFADPDTPDAKTGDAPKGKADTPDTSVPRMDGTAGLRNAPKADDAPKVDPRLNDTHKALDDAGLTRSTVDGEIRHTAPNGDTVTAHISSNDGNAPKFQIADKDGKITGGAHDLDDALRAVGVNTSKRDTDFNAYEDIRNTLYDPDTGLRKVKALDELDKIEKANKSHVDAALRAAEIEAANPDPKRAAQGKKIADNIRGRREKRERDAHNALPRDEKIRLRNLRNATADRDSRFRVAADSEDRAAEMKTKADQATADGNTMDANEAQSLHLAAKADAAYQRLSAARAEQEMAKFGDKQDSLTTDAKGIAKLEEAHTKAIKDLEDFNTPIADRVDTAHTDKTLNTVDTADLYHYYKNGHTPMHTPNFKTGVQRAASKELTRRGIDPYTGVAADKPHLARHKAGVTNLRDLNAADFKALGKELADTDNADIQAAYRAETVRRNPSQATPTDRILSRLADEQQNPPAPAPAKRTRNTEKDRLNNFALAIGTDKNVEVLTTVRLRLNEQGGELATTDQYRLHQAKVENPTGTTFDGAIDGKGFKDAVKKAKGNTPVTFHPAADGKSVDIKQGDTTLGSAAVKDVNFPMVENLYKEQGTHGTLRGLQDDGLHSLGHEIRKSRVGARTVRGQAQTAKLHIDDTGLKAYWYDKHGELQSRHIPTNDADMRDAVDMDVNADYLADVLTTTTPDTRIEVNGPTRPLQFAGADDAVSLIMPTRRPNNLDSVDDMGKNMPIQIEHKKFTDNRTKRAATLDKPNTDGNGGDEPTGGTPVTPTPTPTPDTPDAGATPDTPETPPRMDGTAGLTPQAPTPDNPVREGRNAIDFKDFADLPDAKRVEMSRAHAHNLDTDQLIAAYGEARDDFNAARGSKRSATMRNAYKQELDNRRLTRPQGHGTAVPKNGNMTTAGWGNHMEKWSMEEANSPDSKTSTAARKRLDFAAEEYVQALIRDGNTEQQARKHVDAERTRHPQDPHGKTSTPATKTPAAGEKAPEASPQDTSPRSRLAAHLADKSILAEIDRKAKADVEAQAPRGEYSTEDRRNYLATYRAEGIKSAAASLGLKEDDLAGIESWQDDFNWSRLARAKKPETIERALGDLVKADAPEPEATPKAPKAGEKAPEAKPTTFDTPKAATEAFETTRREYESTSYKASTTRTAIRRSKKPATDEQIANLHQLDRDALEARIHSGAIAKDNDKIDAYSSDREEALRAHTNADAYRADLEEAHQLEIADKLLGANIITRPDTDREVRSIDGVNTTDPDKETLVITHGGEDGTLISGTRRGDGTGDILKANGWKWSRNLGAWYVPRSIDQRPDMNRINKTSQDLIDAGHTSLGHDIDNSRRDVSDIEAAKIDRQADRVDALDAKANRKAGNAEGAWGKHNDAVERLPFGAEPIKIGHHSEGRHRRDIARAWQSMGKAVEAEREAQRARGRADAAKVTTAARYNPATTLKRIDRMEADQRRIERQIKGVGTTGPDAMPATGARRDHLLERYFDLDDDINYWKGISEGHAKDGKTVDVANIKPGDIIRANGRPYRVAKVNKKTVAVEGPRGFQNKVDVADIVKHEPLTGEQRAARDAEQAAAKAAEAADTTHQPGARILKKHLTDGEKIEGGKIRRGEMLIRNGRRSNAYEIVAPDGKVFAKRGIINLEDLDQTRQRADRITADYKANGGHHPLAGTPDAELADIARMTGYHQQAQAQELLAARKRQETVNEMSKMTGINFAAGNKPGDTPTIPTT